MKKMSKLLAIVMVCMVLSAVFQGCGSNEEATVFRSAKVLSVSGAAGLLRGDVTMELYEGLLLQGGDQITTGADGRVDLKLDEDKFIVLEAGTQVTLELEGSAQKGAIRLHQVSGTIHHTIENPLAADDSYEVHTPDAVMAVRGTDFTTITTQTEQGTQTETVVREGSVEMTPNNPEEPAQILGPGESGTAETRTEVTDPDAILCPGCTREVDTPQAHLLPCGEDHYSCDGSNHDLLPCDHLACEEGDHFTLHSCGAHPACSGEEHDSKYACGHFVCAQGDHESTFACGHFTCGGGNHDALECAHFACDAGDHSKLICGSYACAQGHGPLACGHCICDQTYEDHSSMPCGHYACNPEDVGHYLLPCGNYDCRGTGHRMCYGCERCICTGSHTERSCGHLVCETGDHGAIACGHYACAEGDHTLLDCGHFGCDGNEHDRYLWCGNLICTDGHGELSCGHCICDPYPEDHVQMDCGHYPCDETTTGDHVMQSCGNYDCWGNHMPCPWCDQCICSGEHGEGVCNSP